MNEKTEAKNRILALFDSGSFVELFGEMTRRNTDFNTIPEEPKGDGVITGYGLISGRPVYVYSQDETIYHGSVGEMHLKKIEMLYDMAFKTGSPVIGMISSSGLRLTEVTDGLQALGKLWKKKAEASGRILQIDLIFGSAGGGSAIATGLSDFVLMEKNASLFVHSPNALPGNSIEKKNTLSADFRMETGDVDFIGSAEEIIEKARILLNILPYTPTDIVDTGYEDDLNRLTPNLAGVDDIRTILSEISDNGLFTEVKDAFAPDMITGFVSFDGQTVAVIANEEDSISASGLKKAAAFVRFADGFSIPLLSLSNAVSFSSSIEEEGRIISEAANLISVLSSATIPKVNVLLSKVRGTAYLIMNSQAIGADVTFAFKDTKIEVMDPNRASLVIGEDETFAERFRENQTAIAAAKRGYVDCIIEKKDMRKHIVSAFEFLSFKNDSGFSVKHRTK